jgi:hypothetical protein
VNNPFIKLNMRSEDIFKLIVGGAVGVVVLIVVIFSFFMDTIEPTEAGLLYNSFSKSV